MVTSGIDEVVLSTKLFPPPARDGLVARPRLLERMHAGLRGPLTLVVAPAGWGKSTLVGHLLREDGVAAGWVSLDGGDDDPKRFWRYLLTAAAGPPPHIGVQALRRLDGRGSEVLRDVLPAFVNEVVAADSRVVVVLDDYHVVGNHDVHAGLAALIDRAPPDFHLVLITRADPPLPLSRLRVRGQLVEMRAEHLGFTADEAEELLNDRLGLGLARADVERLVTRTEGWAAALQLAALRLREHADPAAFVAAFSGADRHLVDYLGDEVLAAQPPQVRRFLLRTSVLDRFSAPLCDAVTGGTDGVQRLADVMRANLFLIRLDDEDRWFRYHHLFGGLLRHELERTDPDAVPDLRRRAARWHAAGGDLAEAVGYALAAGDVPLSAELIAAGWRRQFNAGQWATVQAWLRALPADVVRADPALSQAQVWLALDNGRLDEAAAVLDAAQSAAPGDVQLRLLAALRTYKSGDLGGAAAALAALDLDGTTDPFVVTVHRLLCGLVALWSGAGDEADAALAAAARLAAADGNRLAEIYAVGCRALVAVNRDDLDGAGRLIDQAELAVRESLADAHFIAGFPLLARARLELRRGDLVGAGQAASGALELARRGAGRGEVAAALLTAALVERHTVERHTAEQHTAEHAAQAGSWAVQARAVLQECPDPGPVLESWLAGEQRAALYQREPRPAAEAVAALTERELAILRLLPGSATQRQLAATLFVTPNTLKTHLRAVYRKLGVESRADAVLRGREAGLL
jgi:LuxR family maltose regulon positive regulatory protein